MTSPTSALVIWAPNDLQMKIPAGARLATCSILSYSPKSNVAAKSLFWSQRLFSMGNNSNILFSTMRFSYSGNSQNFLSSWGSEWAPGGLFVRFGAKKGYFLIFCHTFLHFLLFKIFYTPKQ